MVSNIKNLQGNKNNEILKLMKTVTIGEKDGIKQGLNMNCNIKLLLSFFFFFFLVDFTEMHLFTGSIQRLVFFPFAS